MIDNNWYLIESTFYNMYYTPQYDKVSQEDMKKWEGIRNGPMIAGLVNAFNMARNACSRIPPNIIAEKVNPQWFMNKALERCPDAVKLIKRKGEVGEKWVTTQCAEIIFFLQGKLIWDNNLRRLVVIDT